MGVGSSRNIIFDAKSVPVPPVPEPDFVDPTGGDLVLYLEADAINPDTDVVGGAVQTWPDSSTFSNDAVQTTGSARPTYMTSSINGLPTVDFPALGDYMDLTSLVNLANNDFTVFAIVKFPDSVGVATPGRYLVGRKGAGVPSSAISFGSSTSNLTGEVASVLEYNGGNVACAGVTNITITSGSKFYTFGLSGSVEDISIDDISQSITQGSVGGLDSGAGRSMVFNTISNNTTVPLLGELALLLVFNSRLNAADEDYVYTFFSDKYAL